MSNLPTCPNCGYSDGYWPVRRLAHSDERGLECPSCGMVMTEAFLRNVLGVTPFARGPRSTGWPDETAEWVWPETQENPAQPSEEG